MDDEGSSEDEDDRSSGRRLRRVSAILPDVIRRHYAAKFVVAFLLVVVVIAVVGGNNYLTIRDTVEGESTDKLRSTAQIRADIVSQWVRSMEAQTRLVSSSDVFADDDLLIRLHLRRAEAEATSGVVAIHYVTTTNWTIVESTDVAYQGRPVASVDEPWTSRLREMSPSSQVPSVVRSTAVAYSAHEETVVAFMSPTPRTNGAVVLVGSVEQPIAQFDQFPALWTTIVNADGQPLVSGTGSETASVDSAALSAAVEDDSLTFVERNRDIEVYAPVTGSDWVTITRSPKSAVFQSARAVSRNVRDIIVASVLSLAVVAVVLGRHTIVPLVRLRRRTEQLQAGNFDVDLSTDRVDEVGRLFETFDEMRTALSEQMTEVERSRERLRQQNERLEAFVDMLSHDLRNPLMVVSGRLEAMDDAIPEEHKASIDRSIRRMEAIIDDVLTLARQDRWDLDTSPVELSTVVETCWDNTNTDGARLVVESDRTIVADDRHLQHLFENLFRNAVEHSSTDPDSDGRRDAVEHSFTTPGSGRRQDGVEHNSAANAASGADRPAEANSGTAVDDSDDDRDAAHVTVRVGALENGFYVADDGPGIPGDERAEVFEAGFTTNEQGTGLGLNIVQNIVDTHGWAITVTESATGGARFEVTGVDGE